MSERPTLDEPYTVKILGPEPGGSLVFTFDPKVVRPPQRSPRYSAAVTEGPDGPVFDWSGTPDDPGTRRDKLEAFIAACMRDRKAWIERVTALANQVEQWAKELGWATRRIDKRLDDPRVGNHHAPGLYMQQDFSRVLLEPISPFSSGAEGVVDLYLMPAYDDVATLFYYANRWNIHANTSRGTNAVTPVSEAQAIPLSKQALGELLAEMKQNAA